MVKIEELKGEELVKSFAEDMEEMLGRKMKSVKVMRAQAGIHQACFNGRNRGLFYTFCVSQRLAEAAEDADLYHDYNDTLEVRVHA